jgi:hypothetical protein
MDMTEESETARAIRLEALAKKDWEGNLSRVIDSPCMNEGRGLDEV